VIRIRELYGNGVQKRRKNFFFFYFMLFIIIIILIFFFQSYYTSYSLHDYKLKNTQECITQMLTSKPIYKESKCMWGCITRCRSCTIIQPCVCVCACSQDLKLAIKQALELLALSSFQSLKIQNFTVCSLFLVSLLPYLRYC